MGKRPLQINESIVYYFLDNEVLLAWEPLILEDILVCSCIIKKIKVKDIIL
jgi:hypothetical protein